MKIKKILLGIFIIGASITSISNAGYTRQIGVRGYQPYDQTFNVEITKNGTFLSETLGVTKKIFIIDGQTAFFWNKQTGVPYFIGDMGNGGKMEGLINKYLVCDEIISEKPTNCSYREVNNSSKQLIGTFLTNVTNEDNFYFDKGTYCANGSYNCRTQCSYVNLCISSSNLGQSICFEVDSKPRGLQGPTCDHQDMLTGGRNLYSYGNDVFSNIPSTFLENPPSVGLTGNTNNTQTNYKCPTIGELKKQYNLQEEVCYAGYNTEDMRGDNSTYGQVKGPSIFEVYEMYSGGMTLQQRYETYTEYYNHININTEQFTGKSKVLLGIFFARQVFGKDKSTYNIINYCNLVTSGLSDNTSTCVVSTGAINQNPVASPDEIIDNILKNPKNRDIVLPGNTTINQSGNTNGTSIWTDIVEDEKTTRDIIGSIQSIYSKVTGIFIKREGRSGIIPDYITRILLIIVLFKIFKK